MIDIIFLYYVGFWFVLSLVAYIFPKLRTLLLISSSMLLLVGSVDLMANGLEIQTSVSRYTTPADPPGQPQECCQEFLNYTVVENLNYAGICAPGAFFVFIALFEMVLIILRKM